MAASLGASPKKLAKGTVVHSPKVAIGKQEQSPQTVKREIAAERTPPRKSPKLDKPCPDDGIVSTTVSGSPRTSLMSDFSIPATQPSPLPWQRDGTDLFDSSPGPAPPKRLTDSTEAVVFDQLLPPPSTPHCSKCKLPVESLKVQITGKKQGCWKCNGCNTKHVSCVRLCGSWPIEQFKGLTEQEKVAFWRVDTPGMHHLEKLIQKQVLRVNTSRKMKQLTGQYLPPFGVEDSRLRCRPY